MMISRKKAVWLVFAFAVVVRIIFFASNAGSPFMYFHRVAGLDMATLLEFSEWGGANATKYVLFVPHRLLIFTIWYLNGCHHLVGAVFAVQALVGAIGAAALADIALRLFRHRWTGMLAGVCWGAYGPELLYEFSILQEGLSINLCLIAFWALLIARDHRFAGWAAPVAGTLFGLASVGRPTVFFLALGAIIWVAWTAKQRRVKNRPALKRTAAFAGGVAGVWLVAATFNAAFGYGFNPFFRVLSYTLEYNAPRGEGLAGTDARESEIQRLTQTVLRMTSRLPKLAIAREIPENLNYYFLRERLAVLRWLPGPVAVMIFGVAGGLLLIFSGDFRCRFGVVLLPLALLALPLCVREVIGRYRMMLIPYVILLGIYWLTFILRPGRLRHLGGGAITLGAALYLQYPFISQAPWIRGGDFVAWGLALEARDGGVTPESLECFREGGCYNDPAAAVNVITRLLSACRFREAEEYLDTLPPKLDGTIFRYYRGLLLAATDRLEEADEVLSRIDPGELPRMRQKLFYLQGEVKRLRGDKLKAREFYELALKEEGGFSGEIELKMRMLETEQRSEYRGKVSDSP